MRSSTAYALFVAASTVAAFSVFTAACGSTVSQNASSSTTGTGGAASSSSHTATTGTSTGTTTTATGTTTTGTSTGTTTTASSSSGGGNDCDMACAKALQCTMNDVCALANINCQMQSAFATCASACINDPGVTCADIQALTNGNFNTPLGACLQGCQGGGPGATSSSSGGGMACQNCTFQNCMGEAGMCAGNNDCIAWAQCVNACADQACVQACSAAHPASAMQQQAVTACTCQPNACQMQCGALCP